jgi:hypothetical protein
MTATSCSSPVGRRTTAVQDLFHALKIAVAERVADMLAANLGRGESEPLLVHLVYAYVAVVVIEIGDERWCVVQDEAQALLAEGERLLGLLSGRDVAGDFGGPRNAAGDILYG